MNTKGLGKLRIRVRPSPEAGDHEVCLLADEANLVDCFATGLMGSDPGELLIEPCMQRGSSARFPQAGILRVSLARAFLQRPEARLLRLEPKRLVAEL